MPTIHDAAWTPAAGTLSPEDWLSSRSRILRETVVDFADRRLAVSIIPNFFPPEANSTAETLGARTALQLILEEAPTTGPGDRTLSRDLDWTRLDPVLVVESDIDVLWPVLGEKGGNIFRINSNEYASQLGAQQPDGLYWDREKLPGEGQEDQQYCTLVFNRKHILFSLAGAGEEPGDLRMRVRGESSIYQKTETMLRRLGEERRKAGHHTQDLVPHLQKVFEANWFDRKALEDLQGHLANPENPHLTDTASVRNLTGVRIYTPLESMGWTLRDTFVRTRDEVRNLLSIGLDPIRPEAISEAARERVLKIWQENVRSRAEISTARLIRRSNQRFIQYSSMFLLGKTNPNTKSNATRIKLPWGANSQPRQFAKGLQNVMPSEGAQFATDSSTVYANFPLKSEAGVWKADIGNGESSLEIPDNSTMIRYHAHASGRQTHIYKMLDQAVPFAERAGTERINTPPTPGHSLSCSGDSLCKGDTSLLASLRIAFTTLGEGTHEDSVVLSESAARDHPVRELVIHKHDCHDPEGGTLLRWDWRDFLDPGELRSSLSADDQDRLDSLTMDQNPLHPVQERDAAGWLQPGEKISAGEPDGTGQSIVGVLFQTRQVPGTQGGLETKMIPQTLDREAVMAGISPPDPEAGMLKLEVQAERIRPSEVGDKYTTLGGAKGVVGRIVPDSEMPRDPETGQAVELCVNPVSQLARMIPTALLDAANVNAGQRKLREIQEVAATQNEILPGAREVLARYLPLGERAVSLIEAGNLQEIQNLHWPWEPAGESILALEARNLPGESSQEIQQGNLLAFLQREDLPDLQLRYTPRDLGGAGQARLETDLGVTGTEDVKTLTYRGEEIQAVSTVQGVLALNHMAGEKLAISVPGHTERDGNGLPIRTPGAVQNDKASSLGPMETMTTLAAGCPELAVFVRENSSLQGETRHLVELAREIASQEGLKDSARDKLVNRFQGKLQSQSQSQNQSPEKSKETLYRAMGLGYDTLEGESQDQSSEKSFRFLSPLEIREIDGKRVLHTESDLVSRNPDEWSRIQLPRQILLPRLRMPFGRSGQNLLEALTGRNPRETAAILDTPDGARHLAKQMLEVLNPEGVTPPSLKDLAAKAKSELEELTQSTEVPGEKKPRKTSSLVQDQIRRTNARLEALEFLDRSYPGASARQVGAFLSNGITDSILVPPQRYLQGMREPERMEHFTGNLERQYRRLVSLATAFRNRQSPENLKALNLRLRTLTELLDKEHRRLIKRGDLGRRTPGSARAVITPWADAPDRIALPWKMASKMLGELAVPVMLERYPTLAGTRQAKKWLREAHPHAVETIRKLFEERPVIAGRYPTLHRGNLASFQVFVKDDPRDATVGWPCGQCSPMNADFDGDTVHVSMPFTKERAQAFHKKLSPLAVRNLRRPQDGSSLLTFSHEVLDGLCRPRNPKAWNDFRSRSQKYLELLPQDMQDRLQEPFQDSKDLGSFLLEVVRLRETGNLSRDAHRELYTSMQRFGFENIGVTPEPAISLKGLREIGRWMQSHFETLNPVEFPGKVRLQHQRENPGTSLPGENSHDSERVLAAQDLADLTAEMCRYLKKDLPQEPSLGKEAGSILSSMQAGARVKPLNLVRICFSGGPVQDTTNGILRDSIPEPMLRTLDFTSERAQTTAVISAEGQEQAAIAGPGDISNKLLQCLAGRTITQEDCGNPKRVPVFDSASQDPALIDPEGISLHEGKIAMRSLEGIPQPEAPLTSRDIREIRSLLERGVPVSLEVRDSQDCEDLGKDADNPHGICACCNGSPGTDPDGKPVPFLEPGIDFGALNVQSMTEVLVQNALSGFKSGGAYTGPVQSSMDVLRDRLTQYDSDKTPEEHFADLQKIIGVSRATLHNKDFIAERDIREGVLVTSTPGPARRMLAELMHETAQQGVSVMREAPNRSPGHFSGTSKRAPNSIRLFYGNVPDQCMAPIRALERKNAKSQKAIEIPKSPKNPKSPKTPETPEIQDLQPAAMQMG